MRTMTSLVRPSFASCGIRRPSSCPSCAAFTRARPHSRGGSRWLLRDPLAGALSAGSSCWGFPSGTTSMSRRKQPTDGGMRQGRVAETGMAYSAGSEAFRHCAGRTAQVVEGQGNETRSASVPGNLAVLVRLPYHGARASWPVALVLWQVRPA